MKILIKLGGTLLEDVESRMSLAAQIALIAEHNQLVVVHGGGKQVSRFLEERGIKSNFVNGLRVSDDAVIDAVTKVIAGTLNKELVSAITAAGCPAVGLSGVDGPLTTAIQLSTELGAVGKPIKSDGRLLDVLVRSGYLPVVACIAGGPSGEIYNVNADQMAVSCGIGWQADKLFFLTDVSGVKGENGTVIPHLTPGEIADLVTSGVAHGGMQAKLEAAHTALRGGLSEIVIALGREPDICARLLANEPTGTRVAHSEPAEDF